MNRLGKRIGCVEAPNFDLQAFNKPNWRIAEHFLRRKLWRDASVTIGLINIIDRVNLFHKSRTQFPIGHRDKRGHTAEAVNGFAFVKRLAIFQVVNRGS